MLARRDGLASSDLAAPMTAKADLGPRPLGTYMVRMNVMGGRTIVRNSYQAIVLEVVTHVSHLTNHTNAERLLTNGQVTLYTWEEGKQPCSGETLAVTEFDTCYDTRGYKAIRYNC